MFRFSRQIEPLLTLIPSSRAKSPLARQLKSSIRSMAVMWDNRSEVIYKINQTSWPEINPSKKWRYHHLLRNCWAPNVPCRKRWRLLSELPAMQSSLGQIKPSAELKQISAATKLSTQNCRVSFFYNVVLLWLQKPHNGEYTYLRTKRSPMSRVYTQPLRKQRDGDGI